jgi:hypothetical protein
MKKMKVMFTRFPGGGMDRAEVTDWLVDSVVEAKLDPRVEDDIYNWRLTDTPITMSRNRCIEVALKEGIDFLVMVDNDMAPDLYSPGRSEYHNPEAKHFYASAFDFLYQRRETGEAPAVIGAPYCGPSPHENIFVFQWRVLETNCPSNGTRISLQQFTREQAAIMTGIQEVGALATGLIMIDMECIKNIAPPYFYYEWTDEKKTEKASTEDVTFTRDLSLNGVPQFCNWDSWAGHWKPKCVGMPIPIPPSSISEVFRRRILSSYNIDPGKEDLVFMKNGEAFNGPDRTPSRPGRETESVRLTET